ncbi:MAG TPA: 16S rRNA (guanine(966)-N(2))-methyltransferase RsmD [Thermoleophilaceae bacterium]|nr:16S rRNA (guanine(966)-N(2))-methyltransferase RsmD [Thermoleophilaceae bacterium]
MRVIAGTHRGRPLTRPPDARPTADRVREALFSMLGDVTDADVLDLYAGSGALGIEALSRGAASAVFVDSSRQSTEAVQANLTALGERGEVVRRDALDYLRAAPGTRRFDLVLCDPPYDSALAVADSLAELLPAVLYDTSVTVTESDTRTPLDLPFPVVRERAYGNTRIVIHRGF